MNQLTKIRDVSIEQGVSVRTLRYYEELGLIKSVRESDTTSRSYEKEELQKLKQVLLLRKMNISLKDIQMIFSSNKIETLFSCLDKKENDIDLEIAKLHELKKIVNKFIKQLKEVANNNCDNQKLLLEKVNDFENELEKEELTTDEKEKMTNAFRELDTIDVRICDLPACKMVSSGHGFFGMQNFTDFDNWFSTLPTSSIEMPKDFLWYDPKANDMVWWYIYNPSMGKVNFEIEDFEGGLYALAVSKDGDDEDGNRVYNAIKKWISESDKFVLDERDRHYTMSHIITSQSAQKILGYSQLEILVPIKLK